MTNLWRLQRAIWPQNLLDKFKQGRLPALQTRREGMDFNDEAMKGAVLGLAHRSRPKVIVDMVRTYHELLGRSSVPLRNHIGISPDVIDREWRVEESP